MEKLLWKRLRTCLKRDAHYVIMMSVFVIA